MTITGLADPLASPGRSADVFADLFELDPVLLAWTDLTDVAAGPFPSGRLCHAFASFSDRIYVHGGIGYYGEGEGVLTEGWKLGIQVGAAAPEGGNGRGRCVERVLHVLPKHPQQSSNVTGQSNPLPAQ